MVPEAVWGKCVFGWPRSIHPSPVKRDTGTSSVSGGPDLRLLSVTQWDTLRGHPPLSISPSFRLSIPPFIADCPVNNSAFSYSELPPSQRWGASACQRDKGTRLFLLFPPSATNSTDPGNQH
ncbi:unnamed protein product [Pleuronectes platessa]|uniref:Uncharacterized protein n=1 Tax=Pleuronectes platessa TaxID=8262 RepID=A0A9N7TT04_PLEPL|nr:unnamed protein product [Pleuronectes platessa]